MRNFFEWPARWYAEQQSKIPTKEKKLERRIQELEETLYEVYNNVTKVVNVHPVG